MFQQSKYVLRWAAISAMPLTFQACASLPPPLTREEYLATTVREYPDRTPDQVIAAAEQVLKLDDGNDVKFADNPTGFVATRNWSVYVVLAASFGTDTWIVQTQPVNSGTKIVVQVGSQASAVTPMMTSNGGMSAMNGPMIGTPVAGNAIYDVFWARLEYLLGKRPDWMTCDVANERVKNKIVWGDNSALCNDFNVKDQTPTEPMIKS